MKKLNDTTLYVVSGFMRTGTSMMMRALEKGGLDAEYQQSREKMRKHYADESYDPNLGGLYELERKDYNDPDFPRGYEGKLIKALNTGVLGMRVMGDIKVVFMRRDAEEIRQSYLAFFNQNMKRLDSPEKRERFQKQMDKIVERIKNRRDVSSFNEFWFRDVVQEPRKYFQKLKDNGWDINVDKAVEVVDPELCRYKKENLEEGVI